MGNKIAEMLSHLKIPFLVIELDPLKVDEIRKKEIPSLYGDVSNREVLIQAGISCASLFLIAVPDPLATRQAVTWARKLNPGIDIVVRAHSDYEVKFLKEMGISSIIQPENEASLEMVRHTLCRLGFPEEEAWKYINSQRTPAL